jgi:prolyl-tRNA synthetase
MNAAGASELLMPALEPFELFKDTKRDEAYGDNLFRVKDRKGGDFCIGPTHEEVMTALVRDEIKSYRQLPLNLFQIQTKFRDEVRPRAGLLRGREFIMKDGYSFDIDEEAAKKTYQVMYDAYVRIFDRCGLSYRPVEADTGNIGGNMSHEFQVLADSGEDSIVSCASCNYTANVEKAELQQVDDSAFVAPAGSASWQCSGGTWLLPPTTPGTTPDGPSVVMGE